MARDGDGMGESGSARVFGAGDGDDQHNAADQSRVNGGCVGAGGDYDGGGEIGGASEAGGAEVVFGGFFDGDRDGSVLRGGGFAGGRGRQWRRERIYQHESAFEIGGVDWSYGAGCDAGGVALAERAGGELDAALVSCAGAVR